MWLRIIGEARPIVNLESQRRELSVDAPRDDRRETHGCVALRRGALAWSLVSSERHFMEQHPKLTLDWALRCLERALGDLDDGPAERRVRRQFHQLLLAIERDAGDTQFSEPAVYPEPVRVR
jgi:hypothetical protein